MWSPGREIAAAAIMVLLAVGATAGPSSATTKAAAKKAAGKTAHTKAPANLGDSFQAFCEEWMEKLHARERDSTGHMKWETDGTGTRGTYVGYSQEHTCQLHESAQVGLVTYREIKYEKRGPTVAEAERSTPQPVEIYDATEIFHFKNGKWDY